MQLKDRHLGAASEAHGRAPVARAGGDVDCQTIGLTETVELTLLVAGEQAHGRLRGHPRGEPLQGQRLRPWEARVYRQWTDS